MQNNFNQHLVQQQPQQQFVQNGNMQTHAHPGPYMQNQPLTPTGGAGYQSSGNFSFMPQQQPFSNPRTPGTPGGSGSSMPLQSQNSSYGNMTPQGSMSYLQSQQNSPAAVSKSQGHVSGEMGSTTQNQVPSGAGLPIPQSPQQQQKQVVSTTQPPVQPGPPKEFNAASFCRLGQETVQEFVNKIHEMFGSLKATQPPDGKSYSAGVDRKQKLHEMLRAVKGLLKRLRIIYDKVEEVFPSSDTMEAEVRNLIPYVNNKENTDTGEDGMDIDSIIGENMNTEAYRLALQEYHEVADQVTMKNRHLKETIDHLRQIIWDVNTMLAMRKD